MKKKKRNGTTAPVARQSFKKSVFFTALHWRDREKKRERKKHCGEEEEGEESAVRKKKSPILLFVLLDYY